MTGCLLSPLHLIATIITVYRESNFNALMWFFLSNTSIAVIIESVDCLNYLALGLASFFALKIILTTIEALRVHCQKYIIVLKVNLE